MKMKNRLIKTSLCILGVLIPLAATADYYVARNGTNSDTPPYTSWAMAASNIQDAVTAAASGSIIWVADGVYTNSVVNGTVVTINKSLELRGNRINPSAVVIDGSNTNRGMSITLSSPEAYVLIDGFTIANGNVLNAGGGLSISFGANSGTCRVDNCVISNNYVRTAANKGGGGGVHSRGEDGSDGSDFLVWFSNSTIANNSCTTAGGGGSV